MLHETTEHPGLIDSEEEKCFKVFSEDVKKMQKAEKLILELVFPELPPSEAEDLISTTISYCRANGLICLENKQKFREFLNLVCQISSKLLTKNSHNMIFNLLFNVRKDIADAFSEEEVFFIFNNNHPIQLFMIEKEMLSITTVINHINNFMTFKFFFPEIQEADKSFIEEYSPSIWEKDKKKLLSKYSENIESFKNKRKEFHSDEYILKVIRDDNIDEFIKIVNASNLDINEYEIKHSFFEINCDLNFDFTMIVEYCALNRSIKIFKYLVLNKAMAGPGLFTAAYIGGNPEIIHLLEEHHAEIEIESVMGKIIQYHQNVLFDYFYQKYIENTLIYVEHTSFEVSEAIQNANYNILHFLLVEQKNEKDWINKFDLYAKNYIFFLSCQNGNFTLMDYLLQLPEIDVNFPNNEVMASFLSFSFYYLFF